MVAVVRSVPSGGDHERPLDPREPGVLGRVHQDGVKTDSGVWPADVRPLQDKGTPGFLAVDVPYDFPEERFEFRRRFPSVGKRDALGKLGQERAHGVLNLRNRLFVTINADDD